MAAYPATPFPVKFSQMASTLAIPFVGNLSEFRQNNPYATVVIAPSAAKTLGKLPQQSSSSNPRYAPATMTMPPNYHHPTPSLMFVSGDTDPETPLSNLCPKTYSTLSYGIVHHHNATKQEAAATTPTNPLHTTTTVTTCSSEVRVPPALSNVMVGKYCGCSLQRYIRIKLGGVCGDMSPLSVACIIHEATGIVPVGVDMFTKSMGRCSVWLNSEEDVTEVFRTMHQKIWMGSTELGYAILAKNDASAACMAEELHRKMPATPLVHSQRKQAQHVNFPRHLLTVERWMDK